MEDAPWLASDRITLLSQHYKPANAGCELAHSPFVSFPILLIEASKTRVCSFLNNTESGLQKRGGAPVLGVLFFCLG